MLNFPEVKEPVAVKLPKMSLSQYVEFCEFCVKSNPLITPENCLTRDAGAWGMIEPFSFQEQKLGD